MNIKDWVKRATVGISMSLMSVEKNLLGQENNSLTDVRQENRLHRGTLADSLIKGELTQEVKELRWRMYKILGAIEDKKPNKKSELVRIILDDYDNYPLELVKINKQIQSGLVDLPEGQTHSIVVNRKYLTKFCIEKYASKLNVRKINDKQRLLEFCVPMVPNEDDNMSRSFIFEIEKIIRDKKFSSILEIDEVAFITDNDIGIKDYLSFTYNNLIFSKIIPFNGYYVIKYVGDVVTNGNFIFEEYRMDELDKKYELKESRNDNRHFKWI